MLRGRAGSHDPSLALLVALCRRDVRASQQSALLAPLADPAYRGSFLTLAAQHRVSGLVLATLARSGQLTGDADTHCRRLLLWLRRRVATIELERDHVLSLLEMAGTPPVLLKGGALGFTVYRETVERDLQDLDFLVPEAQLKRAVRVLTGQGYRVPPHPRALWLYRRHHFHIPLERAGALRVELHWALDRKDTPSQLSADSFLNEAVEVPRAGRSPLRVPRPELMLLHLVQQNCHESFTRLSRIVDIDRIVTASPVEWDRLLAGARRAKLSAPTAVVLQLSSRLLGTEIPERVFGASGPGRVARLHLSILGPERMLLERTADQRPTRGRLLRLWMSDGAGHSLALLRFVLRPGQLFPPSREAPSLVRGFGRLAHLFLLQLLLYAGAGARSTTAVGRSQMRFWSRKANSSERR